MNEFESVISVTRVYFCFSFPFHLAQAALDKKNITFKCS